MKRLLLPLALLGLSLSPALAQQTAPAPATSLDSFLSQTGTLTLRESLGTTGISAKYGGLLSLEAVRLSTPGAGGRALTGIAFKVNSGDKYATTAIEFIEAGEVADMVSALAYMVSQAPKTDLALKPEFRFSSKSGATVGLFYSAADKGFSGFAKAGTQTVYLTPDAVSQLRQALTDLSATLK